jgi:predicted MFS family arabinose efflux permease
MFAYGFLSVVLALYLSELGFSEATIGVLLSLTLIGDAVISLIMTTTADRFGRRRKFIIGAGLMLASLFVRLSSAVEVSRPDGSATFQSRFGLHRSRGVVLKLCSLFGLDAFAGGFVIQSIVAYWFHVRFGVDPATLGGIFFGANILAGISALAAAWVAARIGLVNTMVFTHLPSNILLLIVPLMPNLPLAIAALLLRFSISQMDVPPRQSYTMAVVAPDERSAAAG